MVIDHDGEVSGCIQAVEENEPHFRSAGIDLFVRTNAQGRGLARTRSWPSPRTSSTIADTTA